ncbi:MAG: universal stress protein [Bacteroidales bacterium]|nr:universal stress protein [Lentimicrobiaceae bacterium]MDD5693838.1 universal stress protein [Bacteroidales bacterium]
MKTKPQDLILVPTDFSATCRHAVDYAADMAQKMKFNVLLLHVITAQTRSRLKKEKKGVETIIEQLAGLKKEVEKSHAIKVTYTAREGSIFDVISQVASEMNVNLIILGTHGKKGLQYLFGSYAFKVVSQSPVPVVVIQQESHYSSYGKIVFPVNSYIESRQQVTPTIGFHRLMGSRILVYKQSSSEIIEKNQISIITGQIVERFEKEKVPYEIHEAAKTSQYEQQLIRFAEEQKADAIVMMTDSRIDQPDFHNSSWSEKLIFNEGSIPVICINPVWLGEVFFGQ